MPPPIITGVEHQSKDFSPYKGWLATQSANWGKRKMLGLHPKNDGYAPGNFIGMIWIGEGDSRAVLHVHSKFNNPRMDYIKMYADCCAHPVVGSNMGECFKCWPDEDYIDTGDSVDFLSVIIISFLSELNQLCVRHLRKNFERRRENFIGKVKGKILVGENLRKNIVRGRLDRVFCEYQSFSDDILENRILRAALERAARYVARSKDTSLDKVQANLSQWIHACRAHLQGVSIMPISRPQFAVARKRGIFAFYRRPLHLAKAVLLNLGFNPHEEISRGMKTLPYAINTAKLFESYAELRLREEFSAPMFTVQTPSKISGGSESNPVFVKPDFYVLHKGKEMPHIIDAKYKDLSKYKNLSEDEDLSEDEKLINSDIYQVIAYSRHHGMLKELNCSKDDNVRLSLVYPLMSDSEQSSIVEGRTIKEFVTDVHIDKIPCPVIEEEKT